MKSLALLLALVPSVAFAGAPMRPLGPAKIGPQTFGKNVTIKNATIQSLGEKGTIDVPAGKSLVVDHSEWGAVVNGSILSAKVISGDATIKNVQLKAPPPGAIGWGGTEKTIITGKGIGDYSVRFTNGLGQSAVVKVQQTLMNVDPVEAK